MKRKICVVSDIHGNVTAFKAMYADSQEHHPDEYWFLGDLLMPGPGVKEIIKILDQMHPTVYIRGNWDDLVVNGVRGKIAPIKPSRIYFGRLAQYVGEHADPALIDRLASWPMHTSRTVNGLRFTMAHNLPNLNMGQALYPTNPSSNFSHIFDWDQHADVGLYAHVHHQLLRYTPDERLVLNPGSVGEPFGDWPGLQHDLRAYYLLLTVDNTGLADIEFRHVDYDRQEEAELASQTDLPYLDLYHLQMKTGFVYTHDQDKVRAQNQKYGYDTQYKNFLAAFHRDSDNGK